MTFHLEAMDPALRLDEFSLAFQTIADAPPGPAVYRLPSIPGYKVLRELGRGGMGVVYLAHDEALKRNVALKMILAGHLAEADTLNRFRLESQAIARLQHPNIVQIYEVSSWEGNPYFALEYLPGGTLRQLTAGKPQQPAWAAEIVVQLAEAMAFAHNQGIIHRDLKPANILLDKKMAPSAGASTGPGPASAPSHSPKLIPKITDFGLAKFDPMLNGIDQDNEAVGARTKTGEVVGTPNYMAPEQAQGRSQQIGPLADIYSLGAILYEMLTGQPPFTGPSPMETMMRVITEEPLNVRRLQPSVPRDLEVICMKCLRKEPFQRYLTAQALADDLRRFLQHEPIVARPIPIWERTWKWAKRRPATACLTGLTVLALLLLLGGGWYYSTLLHIALTKAQQAEETAKFSAKEALHNARLAERQRQLADEQRSLAMRVLDQLVNEVQQKLKTRPDTRALRQSLLNTAIDGLRQIAKSTASTDPVISRVEAHIQLGQIFSQIGQVDEALHEFRQAEKISEELLNKQPNDHHVKHLYVDIQLWFINKSLQAHQVDEAKALAVKLLSFAEAWLKEEPKHISALRSNIYCLEKMGHIHHWVHAPDLAWDCFTRGYQLGLDWQKLEPESKPAAFAQVMHLNWLGKICVDRKDWEKALGFFKQSQLHSERLVEAVPNNVEYQMGLITALDEMSEIDRQLGNLVNARQSLQSILERMQKMAQADPENIQRQFNVILALINLGLFEHDCAHFPDSAKHLASALERIETLDKQGKLKGLSVFDDVKRQNLKQFVDFSGYVVDDPPALREQATVVQLKVIADRIHWLGINQRFDELQKQIDKLVQWPVTNSEDCINKAKSLGRAIVRIRGNPDFYQQMPGGMQQAERMLQLIIDLLTKAKQQGAQVTQSLIISHAELNKLRANSRFADFYMSLPP